jgi:transposase InsO family protein
MSLQEVLTLSRRFEFVMLAQQEGCNFSDLCKRFGFSRKTGYKWLSRFQTRGEDGLWDLPRRPHHSPNKTDDSIADTVIALRELHKTWGARKLRRRLTDLGNSSVPSPSTITTILHRHEKIDADESAKHKAFCSFEHPYPNDLWQMDYKGHFPLRIGRCHPLTVLDDHSRFNILLKACADETTETVKRALIDAFRQYGLPKRMTMDNGSPWGNQGFDDLTALTVWLIRLGILVSHSRPYHPQTQGKDERFHRTLKADAIAGSEFNDLTGCQTKFNEFRDLYNLVRPHDSLDLATPVTRYQPSQRPYPEVLPQIEYWPGDLVRKVQAKGDVFFKGEVFRVSKALQGQPVAFRSISTDGRYAVYFCQQKLKEVQLTDVKKR